MRFTLRQDSRGVRQNMVATLMTANLGTLIDCLVSLTQAVAIGIVLAVSWQRECDKPLKTYACLRHVATHTADTRHVTYTGSVCIHHTRATIH
jgi:hypothetical protein